MSSSKKNNYAFEIRFVEDNIVQVFDIAAKRQKEGTGLPTEYDQDEVLKGQLRYSKLVGSTPSTDNNEEYHHIVTTKRSKNRRSIQRHTFFMMGGDDYTSETISNNSSEDHDSIVTQTITTPPQQLQSLSVSSAQHLSLSTSLPTVRPTSQLSSPPLSPQFSSPPLSPVPLSPISRTPSLQPLPQVKLSISMSQRNRVIDSGMQHNNPTIGANINQISPIVPQTQQYSPEDYTGITMIDSHDDSSKRNIQQEKVAPEGGCCCIIS